MVILWCISGILILAGALFIFVNWLALFETWRTGRFHSGIPLLGAVFLSAGTLMLEATRPYAWFAFLDIGTLLLVFALPMILADVWRNRFGLVEQLRGKEGNQFVVVRLLEKNHCVIEQSIQDSAQRTILHRSLVGTWHRDQGRMNLNVGQKIAVLETLSDDIPLSWRLVLK